MEESWKQCPAPIAKYQVSTLGRVRNTNTGRILKHDVTASLYRYYNLTLDDGKQRKYYAHKLEAQVHLPNPDGHPSVDHINQDRQDNRLVNLRWASNSDQMRNQTRTLSTNRGRKVKQIDPVTGAVVRVWETSLQACLALQINAKNMSVIIRSQRVVAGYKWQYADGYFPKDGEVWKQLDMPTKKPVFVSRCGQVKVMMKNGEYKIKSATVGGGYLRLSLPVKGVKTSRLFFLHRLVAMTYVPRRHVLDVVANHINGNKLDNRADNLEWVTYKANSLHAVQSGLITVCRKVDQLESSGKYIRTFDSASAAARAVGMKTSAGIHAVISGKVKHAGSYKWRYSSTA